VIVSASGLAYMKESYPLSQALAFSPPVDGLRRAVFYTFTFLLAMFLKANTPLSSSPFRP